MTSNHGIIISITFALFIFTSTSLHGKQIALSFDDAPRGQGPMFSGEERSIELLKILKTIDSGNVVFFVQTKNIDEGINRQRIHRYANAGHLIANHTHNHTWLSKTKVNEYINDITKAESLLNGFDNRRPWFRFPYLDEGRTLEKRDAIRKRLAKKQLFNGYVTVDNYDWYIEQKWQQAVNEGKNVDLNALRHVYVTMLMSAVKFYDDLALETLKRSPAHVLLLHENDLAALFIGDLIAELRENGWTIINPDEAYKDPIANMIPKTLKASQGRVAALAFEAGAKPSHMTHLAIEETMIDQLLKDNKVFTDASE